jgi:hypothetical protein
VHKFGKLSDSGYICLTMKDNKTKSVTFRTTKELKDALQRLADKESRTLSNMIEILLQKAIQVVPKKK